MKEKILSDAGQGTLEFIIVTSLFLMIMASLALAWDGWRREDIAEGSMLEHSIRSAPYTSSTTLGISSQGIRDVLEH